MGWYYMGVSKTRGTPKWIVYFMENPIKMDDLGGFPPIFGNIHIFFMFHSVEDVLKKSTLQGTSPYRHPLEKEKKHTTSTQKCRFVGDIRWFHGGYTYSIYYWNPNNDSKSYSIKDKLVDFIDFKKPTLTSKQAIAVSQ